MSVNDHIEVTTGLRGGKPHIRGTRITVSDVVLLHRKMGRALEEIAGTYDLPLAAVYAAMSYYYDNKDEIDARIEEDAEFAEAIRRDNSSRVREKLGAVIRP